MFRITCLALSLVLGGVFPLGAQTANPRLAARVSEKNLTRGQRELADGLSVRCCSNSANP